MRRKREKLFHLQEAPPEKRRDILANIQKKKDHSFSIKKKGGECHQKEKRGFYRAGKKFLCARETGGEK